MVEAANVPGVLTAEQAVAAYAKAAGQPFTASRVLSGGETGATEIRSPDGTRRVLKWDGDPVSVAARLRGVRLAERLREVGWPVPHQHVHRDGPWLFVAQQYMEGHKVRRIDRALVDDVLALHPSRLGLADATESNGWGAQQINILVSGGHGYCLHQPLHSHDARTRRVVQRIEEIGNQLSPDQLSGCDIVHADFHPGNMLQVEGRLAAIIDLDFATTGDSAFDLAFLAVSSLEYECDQKTKHMLMQVGREGLDQARRMAYVANMILRFLDWAIRKNRPNEIDFWLDHADWLYGKS